MLRIGRLTPAMAVLLLVSGFRNALPLDAESQQGARQAPAVRIDRVRIFGLDNRTCDTSCELSLYRRNPNNPKYLSSTTGWPYYTLVFLVQVSRSENATVSLIANGIRQSKVIKKSRYRDTEEVSFILSDVTCQTFPIEVMVSALGRTHRVTDLISNSSSECFG